jgi:hypothetical protein
VCTSLRKASEAVQILTVTLSDSLTKTNARSGAIASNRFRLKNSNMTDRDLMQNLSPTMGTDTPAKGKKIYSVVYNDEGTAFNIIIDLTLVSTFITEMKYLVFGEHSLRPSDVVDQIFEIVKNEDNSLTWEL